MCFHAFPLAQPFQKPNSVDYPAGARDPDDNFSCQPLLRSVIRTNLTPFRATRIYPRERLSEDHNMERPGDRLKRVRERLKLTYRDVEKASHQIALRRGSEEFAIALSRLADMENKQTVPSIYRIYSLSAIYRLDVREVLRWYGVPLELVAADALHTGL